MSQDLDHERCSELLGGYARGELDAASAAAVDRHLRACSRCRAERAAVEALRALEAEPLRPDERARLHDALAGVPSRLRPASATAAAKRRWGARAAPALGAAALVALLAVWLGSGGGTGVGGGEAGGGSAEVARRARETPAAHGLSTNSTAAYGDVASTVRPPRDVPLFEAGVGPLSRRRLRHLGSRRDPFVTFAATYDTADARERRVDFLSRLTELAPTSLRAEIRACAASVAGERALLPAYGAVASLGGDPVLVLGFAGSDGGGALRRYWFWMWPRGSCGEPVTAVSGQIVR
jgi:hypothetical protein